MTAGVAARGLMSTAAARLEVPFPWIDPVALDLPGPLDLRWYGLMYLVGFAVAYHILRRLAARGALPLAESAVGDLVTTMGLGVVLGGRLGYVLFYDLADVLAEPARLLRVWEGGMSFHGGLLGVAVAAAWFARRRGLPLLRLADALALATPPGLLAVRVANFINGELYGRVALSDVPWAVRFPTDPVALRLLGAEGLAMRERELRVAGAYASGQWAAVRGEVPLRHPSQLYEALTEGLLLGLLLWALYAWTGRRSADGRAARAGRYAGTFLLGYGVARSFVELFRQPDAHFRGPGDALGTVLGPFTMGQVLSGAMVLAGAGLLAWHLRRGRADAGSSAAGRPGAPADQS